MGEGVLLLAQNEGLSELIDLMLIIVLVSVAHEFTFVVKKFDFTPRGRAFVDSLTDFSIVMVSENGIHNLTGLGAT